MSTIVIAGEAIEALRIDELSSDNSSDLSGVSFPVMRDGQTGRTDGGAIKDYVREEMIDLVPELQAGSIAVTNEDGTSREEKTLAELGDILGAAVWTSGQYRTLRARGRDTYCILDAPGNPDPTGGNLSTTALQAMTAEANAGKGVKLDLLYGNYRIDTGLKFTKPVEIVGRGRGYWHPKPPSAGDGVSSEAPTQIILTGTGPKAYTVHGISSMLVSGGVVTNPSASLGNDSAYRLSSFETAVATAAGRSRKAFSAGLWFAPGAAGSRLSGLRIIPDGGGVNGLDKYITAGLATDAWAADWDVGLVIEMANQMLIKDVESVGHFRMMGELLLAIPANPADSAIPAMWGIAHENVQTAGFRATEIRGADAFRCVTVGADYIEVPWADDHPFDPSAFSYIGYGTGLFTLVGSTTFTGISKVGSNLRLTGVVSAGSISVGNHIYARRFGGGTSHVTWDNNCKFAGMQHQSGNVCHSSALGANAMPSPGAAFVASGWRMTELEIYGAIQTIEEVAIHVHALSGSRIIVQDEGSGPKPSRIITSLGEADNARVANPAGRTQYCFIDGIRGMKNDTGIDTRPVLDNAAASSAYPSDTGLFALASNMEVPSMEFTKADGSRSFYFDRTNLWNSHSAHNLPSVDNTYDDGSTSFRKRSDFARQQFFGTGQASLTGGAGTPIGSVGGNRGTVYVDESTGKVYVKPTSTGNSDWRELPQILTGSTTWDPASLADGAGASYNVTVTGAVLGDYCIPSFSLNTQAMILTAHVTSADTVTVRLQNETGSTIDLASGTLRVAVFKQ
ncbi:hypothetical protein [Sinorhizobium sp. BG8]|uniref:hypothetical protein n=1 Tax=Sinorhizobium sp. BG8 TaxID=2613773 RepID=UPI00193EA58B|nr:hypothetical protein [Sinorhizobium sp. BG8]QRM55158.1 hypothetical protein F3Y30_11890 [Sinorhizobium sp. BG8]